MSACGFEERVAAFASGDPGGPCNDDDELAAHLPSCASCRAELEEARAVLRQLAPLVESARSPARADAQGELFWADFTRGVRAQLDEARAPQRAESAAPGEPRTRARLAWIAAPALCAAAALVWLAAGRELARPTPGSTVVPPSPVVAGALPEDPANDLFPDGEPGEGGEADEGEPGEADDDRLGEADPAARVAELDDVALDAVLAQLAAADPAAASDDSRDDTTVDLRDVDPYDTLESLDDDQLDAVDATL